jgi:hypothetical protein
MSYDIYLKDPNTHKTIQFKEPRPDQGGTYRVGGATEAWLNITYNYAWFYYRFLDGEKGIRWLYGKPGFLCVNRLKRAIKELGTEPRHKDYWASTPENAGYALSILLKWAEEFPLGIFNGD